MFILLNLLGKISKVKVCRDWWCRQLSAGGYASEKRAMKSTRYAKRESVLHGGSVLDLFVAGCDLKR